MKIRIMALLLASSMTMANSKRSLTTVPSVDLQRYLGKWYEIARYPNRFERECVSDVSAMYLLRKDGNIQVVNACRRSDGKIKESRGYAKIVEGSNNAKLRVTFFWPFFGDYWIIDLDRDYQYAVVSEPKREYLWILSRTPTISPERYRHIVERVREMGFEADRLTMPKHTTS
jgi:apolipoprotein D and lipocalin family protein